MTSTRIKISSIVENQLPQYVVEEFPLVSEFLSQYYTSLESQGNIVDILQNIDQYIKVDQISNLVETTTLTSDVTFFDSTIKVSSTIGFPDSYGLLLIDSEVITYTSKTPTTFEGCVRGFSGTTSYEVKDELTFSQTQAEEHFAVVNENSTNVTNLSILFLKEFFKKVKKQITPGFEERELYSNLNEGLFAKQSIDFYSSKGTDNSFKILFAALYGENVEIIRPRDYVIRPSDAQYRITSDLVVEKIEGNPEDLTNSTLYQDETEYTNKAQGTITKVEKISRGNKIYYVISLDFDYDKDIQPTGTVYGKFSIHPKTKSVSPITSGATTIEVDSTVGYPKSNGNLIVELENGTSLSINYTSKTLNQFLGCGGITQDIPAGTEINTDSFAYGYSNEEKVKIRILGVLSDLEIPNKTSFYSKGDTIRIKTLGADPKDIKYNNWFFNISTKYKVDNILILDTADKTYAVNTISNHSFIVGDSVSLLSSSGVEYTGKVISYNNNKSFNVRFGEYSSLLNLNQTYIARKNLSKVEAENYESVGNYTSNVQNVYCADDNSLYVSAPSLPTYLNVPLKVNDLSVIFSGTFSGTTLNIGRHGFYTGDSVVYKPSEGNSLGISTGVYFIKKISNTEVKLARSKSNIFAENFVAVNGSVVNAKFEIKDFTYENLNTQLLESQKIIRKISEPKIDGNVYQTDPGSTGIFINGVELLNYKSKDNIYYGDIESIIPSSPGFGYDIINPPILNISDPKGSGANGYCSIIGGLERIDILDPGFDYIEDPKIEITGGNGFGADAKINLVSFDHEVFFNSSGTANLVKLNPTNTIGFSTYHKFRDAEEVVYVTDGQTSVGGLSTNSTYFVSVQNSYEVKLYNSLKDAATGTNEIKLTSYGIGNHSFRSKNKKKKIGSIFVKNSGSKYQNKLVTTGIIGINTASDSIEVRNHGYQSGEIIVYNATENPIGGLSSATSYYVTKIDENTFKLSYIGISTIDSDKSFYYNTKQYINLSSSGSGIHKFNYPEIKVSVKGKIGISTLSDQDFAAKIQPIFRGEVQSVFVSSGGVNYGSEDILNYNRQPLFDLRSGSGIELSPIVSGGTIVDVLINSAGSGYNSPPNLHVNGSGVGAILTPVLSNGTLAEVKIINGGVGYEESNTSILVTSAGSSAKFEAQIKSWKINIVERLLKNSQIQDDDGILTEGLSKDYGLQYTHAYAPRQLRSSVQATKIKDGEIVYVPDLQILNGRELTSVSHSPIIGWAYDGNPIYGPYGYSSKSGGVVKCLQSGYELLKKDNRPSEALYSLGFFVEDYTYTAIGDLDEHNGRFGITPEYPNGIYAYFSTINGGPVESIGSFVNYKKPTFPYAIGDSYKSKPIDFNFEPQSNQDVIDINETDWKRNITPYNISLYDYLTNPNEIKLQNSIVKNISMGFIDSIGIQTGGKNYKIGDRILFSKENGSSPQAKVASIKGKKVNQISVNTLYYDNVIFYPNGQEFIGFTSVPHDYANNDIITFTGKYDYKKSGSIKISTNKLILSVGVGSANYTGLVTYFNISGNLNYPNIKENDIYQLGSEQIKVLNIDQQSSRIRVLRNQNGTSGITSYSSGFILTENTRKFKLNFGISTSYNFDLDREFYFDPQESVGLGTTSGVGIVSTIYFSNPGAGITQITIPTQTIYIKDHKLNTGDSLVYSSNGGTSLSVSTDGYSSFELGENSIVYVSKFSNDLIGISTVKLGLSSTGTLISVGSTLQSGILYFNSTGIGNTHSLKTNYTNTLIGQVSKNTVTVSTAETHGLSLADSVSINIKSGISTTFIVKYDDYNRRMVINPKSFSSVDIDNNIININNHQYYTGQKIIYTSTTPSTGLVNEGIYYVIVIDQNKIKLSNTYYQATKKNPDIVEISTSQPGTISLINPPLSFVKNETVVFDLSDPSLSFVNNSISYSAFDLKFYKDEKFIDEFNSTQSSQLFEVSKYGKVGVDSTANVSIQINDNVPNNLFYKLEPININANSKIKKDIIIDDEVLGFNKINVSDSGYNGSYFISSITSNTFNFNILNIPEKLYYEQGVEYYVNSSSTAKGGIYDIILSNRGARYSALPHITSIESESGIDCSLDIKSSSIGKVVSTEIVDIGFNYYADYSLRPTAKFPSILLLDAAYSFDYIGISSFGKNYNSAPSLVVIDGLTNKVITDVELEYILGDTQVRIKKNSKTINKIPPKIIPTNNSNGIKIKDIVFNNSTKDVTVTLGASFSNPEDYPFEIGSKVLIEGISVGVATTAKGYNSSNYNYALFTLTGIDPNIGGSVGVVTYNLSSYIQNGEIPGTFNNLFSDGRIIPESHFPIFNPVLKENRFYKGETVYSQSSSGIVEMWDQNNQYLKVSTTDDFYIGENVRGDTSNSVGIIRDILSNESNYIVGSKSIVRKGWNSEIGFLNNDLQRVHDNDYYQYFSYAIRSKKDLDTWNNPVSSLNHTAGFKKFGNLIVESETLSGRISTDQNQGDFTSIADFSAIVGLNCIPDFDLARENNIIVDGEINSNEVLFDSAIIQDYVESFGNRVLMIDNISESFNSNPRTTQFSSVDSFLLSDCRYKKYFALIQDKRFVNEKQFDVVQLLHNNDTGFINQYGICTLDYKNLGFFDFGVYGSEANLLFYPVKSKYNDYYVELISFCLNDVISGVGTINLGDSVCIDTNITSIPMGVGISTTIVGISSTYRSSKVLVQIGATDTSYYEVDELTIINDGSNVYLLDYGQITTNTSTSSSVGIGTYNAYLSGSEVIIDLIPNTPTSVDYVVNTFNVSLANTTASGVGTEIISGSSINSSSISIASSTSPIANTISSYYNDVYNSSYCIISIEDKTNSTYQVSELLVATNYEENECYITEFGVLYTDSSIGSITAEIVGSYTNIYFTPNQNIDVDVKVFAANIGLDENSAEIPLNNGSIKYSYGSYAGTHNDIKKEFYLTHKNIPIFQRYFDASNPNVVRIDSNSIRIPNNFYVTGEEIVYAPSGIGTIPQPIGIATTSIPGIGLTDKLPSTLYVVRLSDLDIRVSASATDALKTVPKVLELTSVGIGSSHIFTSKNQNKKAIISVDNVIQSPIVSSAVTTTLSQNMSYFDSNLYVSEIGSIYTGDLIKIDDEIMKVTSVGVGSTNAINVIRPWVGTRLNTHSSSSLVTKVYGNYSITGNKIYFTEAPFGKVPFLNSSNRYDEKDYVGIETGSLFSGRVFIRSGILESGGESYSGNYIFDDVSHKFNGIENTFSLKSNGLDVTGISSDNAIVLVNSIFQGPNYPANVVDYELNESLGITSIRFTGAAASTYYDVNASSIPRGGIIQSIASTSGFAYQPLVSAGGTAIISGIGTIQSISIGNSGSGYRVGIQTVVNVGVITSGSDTSTIHFIGTASVSGGHVVSVAITNPGTGYTSSNPPAVIFDNPLSYSNIPLIYSSESASGIGTGALIDIIVGQGSSVISFELKNLGFGYKPNEILTISTGGATGIPTNTSLSFSEFQISIDNIHSDMFAAWTIGSLQVIDSIDFLFDGNRKTFPINIGGNRTTIKSNKGSNIDVQATLLVFINDILQVPGEGYIFSGGSTIRFTEAPKEGDKSKILFYRGTENVDTKNIDILENIKVGDTVTLTGDDISLIENSRLVTEIISSDILRTNIYSGPGITKNESLSRPLTWCKQTEDLIINGQQVNKDRIIYEPYVQPSTNIIQNVGIGSTVIFVESIKAFFDSELEYLHDGTNEKPQNKIIVISQDNVVSASATAVVSTSGTISSINITNSGLGYITTPTISIAGPIGFGTTAAQNTAKGVASIFEGSVTGVAITFGGFGYIEPPSVLIESPKINYETIDNVSYEGDFGVITGIKTTSVGVASTGIIFDLFIPQDSVLRNSNIVKVGIATTGISGIQTGYYFVVSNSNVGKGITSLNSSSGIVGVGTTFIDNIYEVAAVSIAQTSVSGVGVTNVTRVTVSVSSYNDLTGIGFSGFYGEYSWGRIITSVRPNPRQFTTYANNGGISTSPIVQRYNRLKYTNYTT